MSGIKRTKVEGRVSALVAESALAVSPKGAVLK